MGAYFQKIIWHCMFFIIFLEISNDNGTHLLSIRKFYCSGLFIVYVSRKHFTETEFTYFYASRCKTRITCSEVIALRPRQLRSNTLNFKQKHKSEIWPTNTVISKPVLCTQRERSQQNQLCTVIDQWNCFRFYLINKDDSAISAVTPI